MAYEEREVFVDSYTKRLGVHSYIKSRNTFLIIRHSCFLDSDDVFQPGLDFLRVSFKQPLWYLKASPQGKQAEEFTFPTAHIEVYEWNGCFLALSDVTWIK